MIWKHVPLIVELNPVLDNWGRNGCLRTCDGKTRRKINLCAPKSAQIRQSIPSVWSKNISNCVIDFNCCIIFAPLGCRVHCNCLIANSTAQLYNRWVQMNITQKCSVIVEVSQQIELILVNEVQSLNPLTFWTLVSQPICNRKSWDPLWRKPWTVIN